MIINSPKSHVIAVRVDDEMHQELLTIAEELGISLNACARFCLKVYLKERNENVEE